MSYFVKRFPADGDFGALYAASDWLEDNGYSCGSMQRGAPMGVVKGDCIIAKWRNLSARDIRELDGRLDFSRGGDATLVLGTKEDANK